jgi:regulator of sigma E protease
VYLLQLIATISLNLAVLNVIPLPALDGGKLLFILIEKITGKPIHYKREFWSIVGSFCLLLILMLAITVRDVALLFT